MDKPCEWWMGWYEDDQPVACGKPAVRIVDPGRMPVCQTHADKLYPPKSERVWDDAQDWEREDLAQ